MINGLGGAYNQAIASTLYNGQRAQADKTASTQKKEPEKLDALKEAISSGSYKLDMSKTAEAFMNSYA